MELKDINLTREKQENASIVIGGHIQNNRDYHWSYWSSGLEDSCI